MADQSLAAFFDRLRPNPAPEARYIHYADAAKAMSVAVSALQHGGVWGGLARVPALYMKRARFLDADLFLDWAERTRRARITAAEKLAIYAASRTRAEIEAAHGYEGFVK